MIDGQNFLNSPVKNDLRTYDNILIIVVGQGDDCTTGCLLFYNYFNKYYKMIAIYLSKQQPLDADPKAIQQINFTGNLNRGRLLGPLLKIGLPLMRNVLKPLVKSVFILLGLTAAAAATDAAIHKKMFPSGTTTLIISNEEMNDIMKIAKSLEEPGLLIKGVSETIKNEVEEQKGRFLSMLVGILGASIFGNLLTGKVFKRSKIPGKGVIRAGEGTIGAGQNF